EWVSAGLGITVSFESAIVPAWRHGAIRLTNVKVRCGPEHGVDGDSNFTMYDLRVDQIDVTLSLWRWMDGRGLLRACAVRGVRGVVDRRHVWWDPEIDYSRSEARAARMPGQFDLDGLEIEDMLLTVHPWQGFRAITCSIYSASLPRFRDSWLLYDMLNANSIVGMFDGSLFTVHQAHQQGHVDSSFFRQQQRQARAASGAGRRSTHVQIDNLNVDHISAGAEGPIGWITSGRLNVSALIDFPAGGAGGSDSVRVIRQLVDDLSDSIDVVILPSTPDWSQPEQSTNALVRTLYYLDMVDSPLAQGVHELMARRAERESQRRLERQRRRTAAWSRPMEPLAAHQTGTGLRLAAGEDAGAVLVDLQVEFNDIRTSLPLSTPQLGGNALVSSVLVRPVVAYMNAHRTSLPMRCQLRLAKDDFAGAWSFWDSGADDLMTQGIGAAFAQLAYDDRERSRRIKLVGWWSMVAVARQLARLVEFIGGQR
ncbi:Mitochondrial distribution and morphology protein 31, mitochondrial precursor, partial [Linderina pennispora]